MSPCLPTSRLPTIPSTPSWMAGLIVTSRSASSSLSPPYFMVLAASLNRRRMRSPLSELIETRTPAWRSTRPCRRCPRPLPSCRPSCRRRPRCRSSPPRARRRSCSPPRCVRSTDLEPELPGQLHELDRLRRRVAVDAGHPLAPQHLGQDLQSAGPSSAARGSRAGSCPPRPPPSDSGPTGPYNCGPSSNSRRMMALAPMRVAG